MLRRYSLNNIFFAIFLDLSLTLLALLLAHQLRLKVNLGREFGADSENILPLPVIGMMLLIWGVIFIQLGVYDPEHIPQTRRELFLVGQANSVALLVLAGVLYFSFREVSRLLVVYHYGLSLFFLMGWRAVGWRVLKPLRPTRRVLIVGANVLGQQAALAIQQHTWMGLELVGFIDNAPNLDVPLLGSLDEISAVAQIHKVDEVVIALPSKAYAQLTQTVVALQSISVQVWIVPDYLSLALHRAKAEDLGTVPLISLREPALSPYQRLTKRSFDLLLTPMVILLLLPLMTIIALLIKLQMGSPIIFRQQRAGENGRLFTMYKFRTMRNDAEAHFREVMAKDKLGGKPRHDPRVTRLGQWLRRSSLDELPQLFNVLKGEMSLVGPRPEMPWFVDQYEPWQRKRFTVPPGMTGWWQVNGRSDKPMFQHTEDDLYYIQNYSLWLDFEILVRTIPAVFTRKGAF